MGRTKDQTPVNTFVRKRIRFFRRQRGWTITAFAQKIGMPVSSYDYIERSAKMISLEILFRIITALRVPIENFFPSWPDGLAKPQTLTIEAVAGALAEISEPGVSVREVLALVARHFRVSSKAMCARPKSHRKPLPIARAIVAFLVIGDKTLSTKELMRLAGQTRATLGIARRRLVRKMAASESLRLEVEKLVEGLGRLKLSKLKRRRLQGGRRK